MTGTLLFLLRRLVFAAILVLGVSAAVFFLVNAVGNPIAMLTAGQANVTEDQVAALTRYYHLNEPPAARFVAWLGQLARGDLGESIASSEPVVDMLRAFGWETLKIQVPGILLALAAALAVAPAAARRPRSGTDMAVVGTALVGQSVPAFLIGIILILVFAYWLGVLPGYGAYSLRAPLAGSAWLDAAWHMVLPVTMIAAFNAATFVLLLRTSLVDTLRQDYVTAARASGLPERRVIYHHALPNAFGPVLTYLGAAFGVMLASAPVTESVFTWPGIGALYVTAIQQLDYPVIMGVTVAVAVMLAAATLVTDMAALWLDPRIRPL